MAQIKGLAGGGRILNQAIAFDPGSRRTEVEGAQLPMATDQQLLLITRQQQCLEILRLAQPPTRQGQQFIADAEA